MKAETVEHRIIAEKVLRKALPPGVVVHHLDKNRTNHENNNLVICENGAYHHLLHVRQRAKDAGAPLRWRKCGKCRKYDDLENLIFRDNGKGCLAPEHPRCKQVLSFNKDRYMGPCGIDLTLNLLKKSMTPNLITKRNKSTKMAENNLA